MTLGTVFGYIHISNLTSCLLVSTTTHCLAFNRLTELQQICTPKLSHATIAHHPIQIVSARKLSSIVAPAGNRLQEISTSRPHMHISISLAKIFAIQNVTCLFKPLNKFR